MTMIIITTITTILMIKIVLNREEVKLVVVVAGLAVAGSRLLQGIDWGTPLISRLKQRTF
jgi:hypothetical protein